MVDSFHLFGSFDSALNACDPDSGCGVSVTDISLRLSPPRDGTHLHIAVFRRRTKIEPPFWDGYTLVWNTTPADWYLAWGRRKGLGTSYSYEGLEKERGFRTKKEAQKRKREIEVELGWRRESGGIK